MSRRWSICRRSSLSRTRPPPLPLSAVRGSVAAAALLLRVAKATAAGEANRSESVGGLEGSQLALVPWSGIPEPNYAPKPPHGTRHALLLPLPHPHPPPPLPLPLALWAWAWAWAWASLPLAPPSAFPLPLPLPLTTPFPCPCFPFAAPALAPTPVPVPAPAPVPPGPRLGAKSAGGQQSGPGGWSLVASPEAQQMWNCTRLDHVRRGAPRRRGPRQLLSPFVAWNSSSDAGWPMPSIPRSDDGPGCRYRWRPRSNTI
ncbi:hypothetical protein MPTK1_2g17460 [Marchantia polymorpha subsp. ruderalis]|uniref:Uncharacterized protein n=1 Tax=Marchantia polymorpha TaxID=3197 RepID=A0A2R6WG63_MARPO|nr:hypothetical protein MARPO_0094s0014 [Marchantia polymorpha]BBN02710.1 hypothetical protein Mp_2g17460 [Marchantia polymorpha subsp. ruderalis]|eukprot:PTQ32834.1 hypothetical protein MARPO_0094s0014 [Marchantia polymorpha]